MPDDPRFEIIQYIPQMDGSAEAEARLCELDAKIHKLQAAQKTAYVDRAEAVEPLGVFIANVRIGYCEWRLERLTTRRDGLE